MPGTGLPAPRLLVSGFEPFGDWKANPSAWAAAATAGPLVRAKILPVLYGLAAQQLVATIRGLDPTTVIALGMAGPEDVVRIERLAINQDSSAHPDGRGTIHLDGPIVAGGPRSLTPDFPREALQHALVKRGWTVRPSDNAGRYVCNNLFYLVTDYLRRLPSPPAFTFIHIPGPGGWPREKAERFGRDLAKVALTLPPTNIAARPGGPKVG